MFFADLVNILQWWTTILVIGLIFTPITSFIFSNFFDKGYIFTKIISIAFISYTVFVLGFLKILPFTNLTIISSALGFLILNIVLIFKYPNLLISLRRSWKIFFFEEILFLGILFFWSYIHAHQPDIHGLEKYMDYGFINSILRAKYFPPADMWFTPSPINYYYFGHLTTAVLTKLSFLSSSITFNLMLATISALSFTSAFSIGANLLFKLNVTRYMLYAGGLISAFILNFAGNLHTIYLFFKPYANENPLPFWQLIFSPITFPNNYWYPNATRFIHNTIHEFPIYSYVVSDLHGHVLDIPFVLLTIAVLLSIFLKIENLKLKIPLISFLLAVMYMTNAWDGIIYFILAIFIVLYLNAKSKALVIDKKSIKYYVLSIVRNKVYILHTTYYILLLGIGFFLFSLPFNLNFKPFASGIGILCAPKFLLDLGKFGPFLFEPNHCQHSPLWQLFILYGFFYFWIVSFIIFLFKNLKLKIKNLSISDVFVLILIILSTLLIILPEIIYVKDIYPAHYRANTMFKLVYQAFILLSISSGYIIVRLFLNLKSLILNPYLKLGYWVIGLLMLFLVLLYSYFAINSYFGNLKVYSGLNGMN
ncbi:MAG: hypothetical protein HY424_01535, partial [Candidatus Levybacteria bacterium]|nr:hypothetical protein [Candidatus Levybacteria bacterium]